MFINYSYKKVTIRKRNVIGNKTYFLPLNFTLPNMLVITRSSWLGAL